jgi:PleD family two-component response regulator
VSASIVKITLTLSIGVIRAVGPTDTIDALIWLADEALYHCKGSGPNKAIVWAESMMYDIPQPQARKVAFAE